MIILINILVFCTTVMLVMIVYELCFNRRRWLTEKLEQIKRMEVNSEETDELSKSFIDRLIKPAFNKLGKLLADLAPKEIKNNIDKKLIYAGNPYNLNFNSFLAAQMIIGISVAAAAILLISILGVLPDRFLPIVLFAFVFGAFLPIIFIKTKVAKRQSEIQKSLPDFLDLLLVSVEAGLGFDMAMKRVSDKMSGELSGEINRAAEEIRRGRRREEAFRGIVRRTGVKDLSTFISAIIQAEQLGSNIADTLRVQVVSMRQKRRQQIQEMAMKAPIKMLFPLMFFIFPSLFVVLLGPAVIRMIKIFTETF